MTLEEIESLVRSAERGGLAEFEVSRDGATLRLRSAAGPPLGTETPEPWPAKHTSEAFVTAPFVGRFRVKHPASSQHCAETGVPIRKGQIVGFLQVGPVLRPVTASRDGTLLKCLVEDGARVGYGMRLFTLV